MDTKHISLIQEALGTEAKSGKNSGRKKSTEEQKVDETVEMKAFEEYHRNTHHGGGTRGNDSEEDEDDDGHPGGQRIGCQSQ